MTALAYIAQDAVKEPDGSYVIRWRAGVGVHKTSRATAEQFAKVRARNLIAFGRDVPVRKPPKEAA